MLYVTQLISPRGNSPASFLLLLGVHVFLRGDINFSIPSNRKFSSDFSFLTFEKLTFSLVVFQNRKPSQLQFPDPTKYCTITKYVAISFRSPFTRRVRRPCTGWFLVLRPCFGCFGANFGQKCQRDWSKAGT